MPWYEIVVQYGTGEPASGRAVSNDWNFKRVYTDRHGRATFEAGRGKVRVYVDGSDKGSVRPGRSVVTVR
jgi:hypothetical protein